MAEYTGIRLTKSDVQKREEELQKEKNKLIEEQNKQEAEFAKALEESSRKFKRLTKNFSSLDTSLSTTAANLSASTKDTFSGMLAQSKLTKKYIELNNDPKFKEAKALVEQRIKDLEAENEIQENNLREQQGALEDSRTNNVELKALYKEKIDLEKSLVEAQNEGEKGQEKALELQKRLEEEKKKIDTKELAIKSLYVEKIESTTQNIDDARKLLEEAQAEENKIREQGVEALKEASTSKEFDNFNSSLSSLTGGMIDIGGTLDKVTKFFTDLYVVGTFLLKGMSMLGIATPKFITNIKNRFKKKDETDSAEDGGSIYQKSLKGVRSAFTKMGKGLSNSISSLSDGITKDALSIGKGLFGKKKADGSKDMRVKDNQESADAMQRMSDRMNAVTKGVSDTFTKIGNGLKNSMGLLSKGFAVVQTGMANMAKGLMRIGKQMINAMKRLALAAIPFLLGLAATAVGMFIAALPMIGLGLLIATAVAALVFGVMYLAENFEKIKEDIMFRWGLIKEGFSITLDGLILWKDKATSFISDTFKSIWLSIKSLFSVILTGIENGINYVIKGLNEIPFINIDPVNLGAADFAAGLEKDKVTFEAEKADKQKEFADRKNDLADRNNILEEKAYGPRTIEGTAVEKGNMIKDATAEVKQGEKQGNMVNVVNTTSAPTSVMNTQVHNSSGSPTNTDRTALRLNAIPLT